MKHLIALGKGGHQRGGSGGSGYGVILKHALVHQRRRLRLPRPRTGSDDGVVRADLSWDVLCFEQVQYPFGLLPLARLAIDLQNGS